MSGITASALKIEADQTSGELQIAAAKDATPGRHQVTIQAKAKFNKLDVVSSLSLVVTVPSE